MTRHGGGTLAGWKLGLVPILGATLSGCLQLDPRPAGSGPGLVEPEVFEVVRAANSRAAVDYLGQKYHDEMRQVRLLEEQIQQLVAAQAGLAAALEGHREDFDFAREETGRLEEQVAEAEAASASAAERKTQADAARAEAEAALAAATTELEKATAARDALLQQIEAKATEEAALTQRKEAAEGRLAGLQAEVEQAESLAAKLEADGALADERAQLEALIERIKGELGDG